MNGDGRQSNRGDDDFFRVERRDDVIYFFIHIFSWDGDAFDRTLRQATPIQTIRFDRLRRRESARPADRGTRRESGAWPSPASGSRAPLVAWNWPLRAPVGSRSRSDLVLSRHHERPAIFARQQGVGLRVGLRTPPARDRCPGAARHDSRVRSRSTPLSRRCSTMRSNVRATSSWSLWSSISRAISSRRFGAGPAGRRCCRRDRARWTGGLPGCRRSARPAGRSRTAWMKLAKWFSLGPSKVRTSFPSGSNRDDSAMKPSVPWMTWPASNFVAERVGLQPADLLDDRGRADRCGRPSACWASRPRPRSRAGRRR